MSRHVHVVRRSEIWSDGRLFRVAFIVGVLSFVAGWVVAPISSVFLGGNFRLEFGWPALTTEALSVILTIVTLQALLLLWLRPQLAKHGRAFVANLGFGAGLSMLSVIESMAIRTSGPMVLTAIAVAFIAVLPLGLGSGMLIWSLVRITPRQFILQDGTRCPRCGYCIVACLDMTCSECGRRFLFEDLEITSEAWDALIRTRTRTGMAVSPRADH